MLEINKLPDDIIIHISSFLQRTDKLSLSITNKNNNKIIKFGKLSDELNDELRLYIKNIHQMEYAWKNDVSHITIYKNKNVENKMKINEEFALIKNLWYFDFNATYNINPDIFILIFNTSFYSYKINLYAPNISDVEILENGVISSNIKYMKIKVNNKTTLKINCREINYYKNNVVVRWICLIPLHYYNQIYQYKKLWLETDIPSILF